MQVNFNITEESINTMSVEDYEAFERAQDGDIKLYRLRPAICRFMVDENNNAIPHDEAMKVSGKFSMADMKDFIDKFFSKIKEKTVPNGNGRTSPSLSEVKPAASESQTG